MRASPLFHRAYHSWRVRIYHKQRIWAPDRIGAPDELYTMYYVVIYGLMYIFGYFHLTTVIVVVHDYWHKLVTGYFYSFVSMQSWTNLSSIQIVEVNYNDGIAALRLYTLKGG